MIPLVKPLLGIEEQELANEVLASGELAQGQYVKKFEDSFAAYHGARYAVAASSGTAALHTALMVLGIKQGDKVITTPFSFIATANAILYVGAVPVFSDIEEANFNLSPQALGNTLQKHPDAKAVIVVHLYGHPARMQEIMKLADKYGLAVIEDCAQAHGAAIHGKRVGTFGKIGVFSFYPTKNMTCGEGGLLITQDADLVHQARVIINHGQHAKYQHDSLGFNYRMTNIHAAVGIAQLEKLPSFTRKRQEIALRYTQGITNEAIVKPEILPGFEHVFNQYTLQVADRTKLITFLDNKGIGYGIHYPKTIPDQPLYNNFEIQGHFPTARRAAERVIAIPVHPGLSDEEVDYIVNSLQEYEE